MFKVGDKVNTIWGDGYIVKEIGAPGAYQVMLFHEQSDHTIYVGRDGREEDTKYPVVWHVETGSHPVVGTRPIEVPIGFDIDFARDGKIGDEVHAFQYGNGHITHLVAGPYTSSRIGVSFAGSGKNVTFTESGKWTCGDLPPECCCCRDAGNLPSLYWGHIVEMRHIGVCVVRPK